MTYQFPAITPAGVDEHGEVILDENGVPTILTSALSGVDRHLKPQTTSLYNVQIEQQVRGNFVFGIGYTGYYSWNQYASGDYNTYPGDQIANNGAERRLSQEWAGINGQQESGYRQLQFLIADGAAEYKPLELAGLVHLGQVARLRRLYRWP